MAIFNGPLPPTQQRGASLTSWLSRLVDGVRIFSRDISEETQFLADNLVFSQYAAVEVDVPHVDGNIGAGWQPFDFYDSVSVTPKGIVIALSGDFTFLLDGTFVLSLNGFFEHDNLNAGRTFQIRLFNVSQGVQVGGTFVISSGRNTDGTVLPLTAMVEVPAGILGDIFRLEYGGTASVYTNVIWNSLQFALWSVSEVRGVIGDPIGAAALRMTTEGGDFIVTEDGERITTQ